MSNDDFKFGVAMFDNKTMRSTRNWFDVEQGDNLYRVLPPMHSLAEKGKLSYYWRTHYGFKGTNGKNRIVVCQEKSDYKTKMITNHCPVCDMVQEAKNELEFLKQNGKISAAQEIDFKKTRIQAFEAKGRYNVWAVNSDGKIGVLSLKSKAWKSLEVTIQEMRNQHNIDPVGTNGIFINFKRTGHNFETTYTAIPAIVTDPATKTMNYKYHTLTEEIITQIKNETSDLSKLYTPIALEDTQALVSADVMDRPVLVDRIFSKGNKEEKAEANIRASIPGTSAIGVVNVGVDSLNRITVTAPEAPNAGMAVSSWSANPSDVSSVETSTQSAPNSSSNTVVTQSSSSADISKMSDDDFKKMFNNRFGG